MSKYTPSPWKVEKEDTEFLAVYHRSILIADVLDTYGKVSKANAGLIAAAPHPLGRDRPGTLGPAGDVNIVAMPVDEEP